MSALGCTWEVGQVLVLYEHVGGSWIERARADFPEEWVVTAELDGLNSRFALGTP